MCCSPTLAFMGLKDFGTRLCAAAWALQVASESLASCGVTLSHAGKVLGVAHTRFSHMHYPSSALLARTHVSLALHCRAIVTEQKALLFDPGNQATKRLLDTIKPHLQVIQNRRN